MAPGDDNLHIESLRFQASASKGKVSALLAMPPSATAVYVFAHGAGAGMNHPFMESMARRLGAEGIATLRYRFPYMEAKKGRRPDPPAVAMSTVRGAVRSVAALDLPIVAGGKSFGARMTAYAAADGMLPEVRGLVFLGFPLHPAGRPGSERWQPMTSIRQPLLFLQGDRDRLADLDLLRPLIDELTCEARLHVVDGGDHSFAVLKRSGRHPEEVHTELATTIARWMEEITASSRPQVARRNEKGDAPRRP